MNQEIVEQTHKQMTQLTAPAREFAALTVTNMEKLIELQLSATRAYTELTMQQLRAALAIHSGSDLRQYVSQQQTVADTVAKRAAEDAETVAGIGKDFASEAQRIAEENVAYLRDAVKPARKSTTRKPAGANGAAKGSSKAAGRSGKSTQSKSA